MSGGRTAAAVLFPEDAERSGISCAIRRNFLLLGSETRVKLLRTPLYHGQTPLVGLLGLDSRSGARVVPVAVYARRVVYVPVSKSRTTEQIST